MDRKRHWEQVYSSKASDAVSWFQEHADLSLGLIRGTGLGKDAAIIDVGGGASTLVDDLLAENYTALTVLDLSAVALAAARQRLGARAGRVTWVEGDILQADFAAHSFDIWHDRAVFHFLTAADDRRAYVRQVMRCLRPGGHVIVATFAADGPDRCSGLPVVRYQPASLHAQFGEAFLLVEHQREVHRTPSGTAQQFIYCYCRKSQS